MNTLHAAIAVKPKTKINGNAFKAEIIDSEGPCRLSSTIRLARIHESNNKFILAAELHEMIYKSTGEEQSLRQIESLAESAIEFGRPSVAEAIYIKLCRMTRHDKYLAKALSVMDLPDRFEAS